MGSGGYYILPSKYIRALMEGGAEAYDFINSYIGTYVAATDKEIIIQGEILPGVDVNIPCTKFSQYNEDTEGYYHGGWIVDMTFTGPGIEGGTGIYAISYSQVTSTFSVNFFPIN